MQILKKYANNFSRCIEIFDGKPESQVLQGLCE